ncbi:MAG: FadR/GntR family transcriptional regulator [Gemmatimonadaceae bacterium]
MVKKTTQRRTRRRLTDVVIDRIQQQISLGVLAPGDRLPTETELTETLGVSRTTIREAVVVLAHAGLLHVRQGDGTYVTSAGAGRESLDDRLRRAAVLEVYEVRRPLEVEAARLAAERRTEGDVRRMRELLVERDRLREAHDVAGAVRVDVEFHTAIAVASRNAVLADVYRAFSVALRDALIHIANDAVAQVDTTDLHYALADAIDRSDSDGAAVAAARLIDIDATTLRVALAR